jgi:hypothetical protein
MKLLLLLSLLMFKTTCAQAQLTNASTLAGTQSSRNQEDFDSMRDFMSKFQDQTKELFALKRAYHHTEIDNAIAGDFYEMAKHFFNTCDFLADEFSILAMLNERNDRTMVQNVIIGRLSTTIKDVQRELNFLNDDIANVQKPALVVQANKLRDDVKALQHKLEAVLKKLTTNQSQNP